MFNNKEKKQEYNINKENIKPSDVIMRMATYSFIGASIGFIVYIGYLLATPIQEKEKITKPIGIITKKPERLPAKNILAENN